MDPTTALILADTTFPSPVGIVTLTKQLGSGSYGSVWKAITPNKEYAVKVLSKYKLDARQLQIQSLEHTLHAQVCPFSPSLAPPPTLFKDFLASKRCFALACARDQGPLLYVVGLVSRRRLV